MGRKEKGQEKHIKGSGRRQRNSRILTTNSLRARGHVICVFLSPAPAQYMECREHLPMLTEREGEPGEGGVSETKAGEWG